MATGSPKRQEKKAPIYHLRQLRGLTQEEMATQLEIHAVSLSRFENYRRMPDRKSAARIAEVLEQSTGAVIDDYEKHMPGGGR